MPDACIEARRFLKTTFAEAEWLSLLLKHVPNGRALQRTGPRNWACDDQVLRWLCHRNLERRDVYACINPLTPRHVSRTRIDICSIRHVFLDLDRNSAATLRSIESRSDLPQPSYVVHTSPGRAHVLWRVREFDLVEVERLQRRLATALGGDLAATSVTQMTRLPGFWNHKHEEPHKVWVEYWDIVRAFTPRDFPAVQRPEPVPPVPAPVRQSMPGCGGSAQRARVYLARVPPAVAGNHGDLHTFQTCCRIVRGFALDDDQAFTVLAEWNARCQPPWTERELYQKIRSARRNGREPIGGLL